VAFLESHCKDFPASETRLATDEKIRTMSARCGPQILEDKQGLDHGIQIGRGGCWLTQTEEQYRKLSC
jgi:hypothetical protein